MTASEALQLYSRMRTLNMNKILQLCYSLGAEVLLALCCTLMTQSITLCLSAYVDSITHTTKLVDRYDKK
ncbi:hypothetical protein VNO77_17647 [Canavalia gladiata]|uniref:Uncharacterized protein n=1 Tax=Canavalia gladiata TaxID=3824 RepID=A0AAN9LPB8_CANGL